MGILKWTRAQRRNFVKGVLFASPWIVGFLAWTVYPVVASFWYSLTRYDVLRPARFIGLQNYRDILFRDEVFRLVLKNTLFFVVFGVSLGVIVAFSLALLLTQGAKLQSFFRTVFFLPSIVPAVAVALVWRIIYDPRFGVINSTLAAYGIPSIPWLSSPALAKPSLIIVHCWGQGASVMIFLAALQDVPQTLYDAAIVDGANLFQRFRHVTIPMCTPSILFVTVTSLIGMFQYFTVGWLLTQGGPYNATEFYGIYLYRAAFKLFRMGYASALAWLMFVFILIATILLFRSSKHWVHYGGLA